MNIWSCYVPLIHMLDMCYNGKANLTKLSTCRVFMAYILWKLPQLGSCVWDNVIILFIVVFIEEFFITYFTVFISR